MTKRRISRSYRSCHMANSLKNTTPSPADRAKNPTIFKSTIQTFTEVSARLVMMVRAMMPKISSMMAAPKMALPARVLSLPISFKVSTVMLTDVAVRMTPINIFCKKTLALASEEREASLKQWARAKPPSRGTMTPIRAMIKEAFPVRFSSAMSVSSPAVNISTITPTSDSWVIKSVSFNILKKAGPKISPAKSAPTTWGILNFFVTSPSAFVLSRISAKSNKK